MCTAVYIHNPRTCSRYLSYSTALSVISRYTTVFSCYGTPLSCSIIPLLPCCHSSGRLFCISPVTHSSRRLWAYIPHGTSKGCHGDAYMHHGIRPFGFSSCFLHLLNSTTDEPTQSQLRSGCQSSRRRRMFQFWSASHLLTSCTVK